MNLLNLGEIRHPRGEREKALGLYQRAAAVAPRLAVVQVNRGSIALELNRLDVAEEAQEALRRRPNDPRAQELPQGVR